MMIFVPWLGVLVAPWWPWWARVSPVAMVRPVLLLVIPVACWPR